MRVLITADIHCGYPNRLKDNIWSMMAISDYATKNNIDKIICLGDLFHNRDHMTIDVLNAVHAFFKKCKQEWILFPGNHDMFMKNSWTINSVRPLEKYATVYDDITDFELDGRKFIILPFMHYESEFMERIIEAESKYSEEDVLLTHIGVNNATNNSCFLLKYWSTVNLSDVKFSLILTGHFHNFQVIDDKICYPGSPIPFKFDEGMVPHGFIDMDTDTLEVNFVDIRSIRDDCPYDFVTITDDMLEDLDSEKAKEFIGNNKIRVSLNREYSKSELDKIRDNIIDIGAESVSWMKPKVKEQTYENIKVDESVPPFLQWIKTQDVSKYDNEILMKLYEEISEEAEEQFCLSNESD